MVRYDVINNSDGNKDTKPLKTHVGVFQYLTGSLAFFQSRSLLTYFGLPSPTILFCITTKLGATQTC